MNKAAQKRANEILKRLPERAVMAEIGVRDARLSKILLQARLKLKLYAVDNWLAMDKRPNHYRQTGDACAEWSFDEAAETRNRAIKAFESYRGRVGILEADSTDAAKCIKNKSLDLVFLDGDHSEKGVSDDIKAWMPKVKSGGWIGGHDYANPDERFNFGVKDAVDKAFESVQLGNNYTWWVKVWL